MSRKEVKKDYKEEALGKWRGRGKWQKKKGWRRGRRRKMKKGPPLNCSQEKNTFWTEDEEEEKEKLVFKWRQSGGSCLRFFLHYQSPKFLSSPPPPYTPASLSLSPYLNVQALCINLRKAAMVTLIVTIITIFFWYQYFVFIFSHSSSFHHSSFVYFLDMLCYC